MPPIPSAWSRVRLPVEMTAGGGWLSGVMATPGPKRRSTSPRASRSWWAAPGGGASRTVAVGMVGGLLCGQRDTVASQTAVGAGRDGEPVACALALGLVARWAADPTPDEVRASPPSCSASRAWSACWPPRRRAGRAGLAGGGRTGRSPPSPAPCTPGWCGQRSSRGGCPPAGSAARTRPSPPQAASSPAKYSGAPAPCARSRHHPQPRPALQGDRLRRLPVTHLVLLALVQDLGGGQPADQHLAGASDPRGPSLLRPLDDLELGVHKGKPPLRPLPQPAAVGKLAPQPCDLAAVPPPPDQAVAAQQAAKVGFSSDQVGVAAQLTALLLLHPPAQVQQRGRGLVHQAAGGLPPHPQRVVVELAGQLHQLRAWVQPARQLGEEPLAALLVRHVLGLSVQRGVLDLETVTLMQLGEHAAYVGQMAGLLV